MADTDDVKIVIAGGKATVDDPGHKFVRDSLQGTEVKVIGVLMESLKLGDDVTLEVDKSGLTIPGQVAYDKTADGKYALVLGVVAAIEE